VRKFINIRNSRSLEDALPFEGTQKALLKDKIGHKAEFLSIELTAHLKYLLLTLPLAEKLSGPIWIFLKQQ